MKIAISTLLLLSALSSKSQIVQSSCIVPDSIVKQYKSDAYRLAVRRTYNISSTFKDSVRIDSAIRNSYLRALLAVYNATSLPARDTVVQLFKVHTLLNSPDINTFLIAGDTNMNWMADFRNNIFPTSNPTLNNLVINYSFIKTSYSDLLNTQPYHLVGFKSDSCWNIGALANELQAVSGVISSGPNGLPFDGSDITDSINPNYIELNYKLAWGDCMSGCMAHRIWKFRIFPDCSVNFIGSVGESVLGFFLGLNHFELQSPKISIFPNPARSKLNLKIENSDSKDAKIFILSPTGQVHMQSSFSEEIDISTLDNGIYFLRFVNHVGQSTYKIVKDE